MPTYSTYEAKARLSEILRGVRRGQRAVIAHRGTPIAEVRPLPKQETLAERLEELEAAGALTPAPERAVRLAPIARRRGALKRFLASRE